MKLISSPAKAWEEISMEEDRRKVYIAFVYPMIGLCGLSVFVGSLLTNGWGGPQSFQIAMAFLVCLAIFAVSVLVGIDGLGTTGVFPWPATAGWNDSMLDFVDMLSEGLAMPIGALMMSIMVGWEIRPQTVLDELHIGYTGRIDTFYRICIKYITPIGMLLVLAGQVNEFFSLNWF